MSLRRARAAMALAVTFVLGVGVPAAEACDICAIYTSVDLGPSRSGFRLGLAQQYTRFGTRMEDSVEVENPGEKMQSSITQILLGYNFGPEWGLQVNLPIIYRPYTRLESDELVSGSESGLGDLALLGRYTPFRAVSERGLFRLSLFGGLKFPTGNSAPLAEESEPPAEGTFTLNNAIVERYGVGAVSSLGSVAHGDVGHGAASAIHGHDLALGTGSYDGIVGGQLFMSWDRFFWTTSAQYTIRTEGSFDYRFANDLTFNAGPGYYAYLDHGWSVGLQGMVSGETKGQDELAGESLGDTAATYLFAGPALRVAFGANFSAAVMGDIPFVRNETSLQIVPDYRIRGALMWRF
ncbi:MAG: hypothetical protein P8R42_18980 [Candidatus Binatia bacterium]|nr:hypothetical protein [Candidatus Binatia bacterium]